ncbi:TetR family transcriptional regulator [Cryobacterium cryoconiti]|uniref:TetR family transcriptional regulator n=1 Tax=Cryobacterium cryoconiti TaxID=1259239 RepID=A0A4Y8K3U1_9MICO|nr:TetR family transcriptional regulator [Cryobacterium cryoconiti]TFD33208.1 TetR family transcriptional regulator [Cryobacterium cryoconiti]
MDCRSLFLNAAARVSKGGLIHHFPSRAALVQGLAIGPLQEAVSRWEAMVQKETGFSTPFDHPHTDLLSRAN